MDTRVFVLVLVDPRAKLARPERRLGTGERNTSASQQADGFVDILITISTPGSMNIRAYFANRFLRQCASQKIAVAVRVHGIFSTMYRSPTLD